MIFSCNRFAIIPHMCHECESYIWFEAYRRADVWKHDRYIIENICKQCLSKFLDADEFANQTAPIMKGVDIYEDDICRARAFDRL